MKNLFWSALLLLGAYMQSLAQTSCSSAEIEVIVSISTDNFGNETSWSLSNPTGSVIYAMAASGTLAGATTYNDTFCLDSSNCYLFSIMDSYGDGICCFYGLGEYHLIVDGDTIASGSNFTDLEQSYFNCPPGTFCSNADTILLGNYTAPTHDLWAVFIPDSTGIYEITTCAGNSCDTKIWIYDHCLGLAWDESNIGTLAYDDNSCVGGSQAVITAALEAGLTYYIRLGDHQDDCISQPIDWAMNYLGPVIGCTDPTACNYNPLATISDTCYYTGNPICPDGPDLLLREDILVNSLFLTQYTNVDPCSVDEGCIAGMGLRDIIRFTTQIENIGNQDYYVGDPLSQPGQFSNSNCHGHWHYEGYAEYKLYDQNANPIPIGFKAGFCVIDLVCSGGGSAQYTCSNMGITAGCEDIYDASLDCQWIDVTDVPDGTYTFVARVNWGNRPDALGRYELDSINNWAQTCLSLDRSSGNLEITIDPNCPTFVDCDGLPFGTTIPDCNGDCDGLALFGDLDNDTLRTGNDLENYLSGIVDASLANAPCNDLFSDGISNVYDAALLAQCLLDTMACDFPNGLINIADTVHLSISGADFSNNYIDIAMRNPLSKLLGYQFRMTGLDIDTVLSLVSAAQYPVQPLSDPTTATILALSTKDSLIDRSFTAQPLCRIYFNAITDSEICIERIDALVDENYYQVIDHIEGNCLQIAGTDLPNAENLFVKVSPNPFSNSSQFSFPNPDGLAFHLEILDVVGKRLLSFNNITGEKIILQRGRLSSGLYFYKLTDGERIVTGKLIVD